MKINGYNPSGEFVGDLKAAIKSISASKNTREAYWADARHWLKFCEEKQINPVPAEDQKKKLIRATVDWADAMRESGMSSTTRVRRFAALSSMYDEICRMDPDLTNPFKSPRRERPVRERPTPIVEPDIVARMLKACAEDVTWVGRRDEALLRLLWATGMRRSSAVSITRDRLSEDGSSYYAEVFKKGGKTLRILIIGSAAQALRVHLENHQQEGGHIFTRPSGEPMDGRDVWLVVKQRAREAGVTKRLSPHSFRAAFLTYGQAGLEARQDAAGHSSPDVTKLYDRAEWRGKEAFEKMPEVEDMIKK